MNVIRWALLVVLSAACVGVALLLPGPERPEREGNYSLIEDGLYMGGDVAKPPPGTKAVLNLCEKQDPYRCDFHLWEPIRDTEPAPGTDWLSRMVEFIDARRRAG